MKVTFSDHFYLRFYFKNISCVVYKAKTLLIENCNQNKNDFNDLYHDWKKF